MTPEATLQTAPAADGAAPAPRPAAGGQRQAYVDLFRGLLIAHMALDHASLMFNAGRGGEELAALAPAPPVDFFQFLTRFTGVPVAPGFFFMAGFMVALTSLSRERRGVPRGLVTRRLIIRGLVLIAVDALIMGLPRLAMGFYSFMVLTSIGVSIILLALLRHLPSKVLLPAALAVLCLHPLLDLSALPIPLRAILHDPVRSGAFRSLYPVIPWAAIVVVGFVVGRDADRRPRPARLWLPLAALSLLLFLAVRLGAGYGNAYPYDRVVSLGFWSFAKYPPDLPFLTWSFAIIFLWLAALWRLTVNGVPGPLRLPVAFFTSFGRVPFFFYVMHFYVLGLGRGLLGGKLGLAGTYGVWALLLLLMAWPCAWYYRKKRDRPNLVTRYF
jgi:uncharacterized membrane protein